MNTDQYMTILNKSSFICQKVLAAIILPPLWWLIIMPTSIIVCMLIFRATKRLQCPDTTKTKYIHKLRERKSSKVLKRKWSKIYYHNSINLAERNTEINNTPKKKE